MLKKLRLANWKSHKETEIEFSEGLNVFIGIMGSGKTSIMDGVCFALFGDFPALQSGRMKLENLIRNNEKECEVELELEIDKNTYSILRKISRSKPTEAYLRKNKKLIEGPQGKRVNEHVEQILKVDYSLFTRAIYSEQNNIEFFLALRKGKRKEEMDRLLGLDKFDAVRLNAGSVISRLKDAIKERENSLGKMEVEKLEIELKRTEEEKKEMERRIGELEKGREKVIAEYGKISEEKKRMESTKKEIEEKNKEMKKLEGGIETLKKQLLGVELTGLEKELEKNSRMIEDSKKSLPNLEKILDGREIEARAKEKDSNNLEKEISDGRKKEEEKKRIEKEIKEYEEKGISGKISEMKKGREGIIQKMGELKAQIQEIESALAHLAKESASCPVCDSALTKEKISHLKNEKARKKSLLETAFKECEFKRKEVEGELKVLEGEEEKGKKLAAKLESIKLPDLDVLEEKMQKLSEQKKIIAEEISGLKEKLKKARQEEGELEKNRERIQNNLKRKIDLDEFEEKISKLKDELKRIEFDGGKFESVESEFLRLRDEKINNEKDLEKQRELCKIRNEQMDRIKSVLESAGLQKRKIMLLRKKQEELLLFQNGIVETQRILRDEYIVAINASMGEIWRILYPYGDYRNIRIEITEQDYELQIEWNGKWIALDSVASGGERTCAALSLRIAFATVLTPNLSWLILDEPTHNLDENGISTLVNLLGEKIPTIVNQVFVITHNERLKDAEGKVFKLERNKEKGEESRVSVF